MSGEEEKQVLEGMNLVDFDNTKKKKKKKKKKPAADEAKQPGKGFINILF